MFAQEEYDPSERAALMAVSLISSARVIRKLDRVYTPYSAQYLVDCAGPERQEEIAQQRPNMTIQDCLEYLVEIAAPKSESEQREFDQRLRMLTVKDCLDCAFKDGIPKSEHWTHLGCVHKPPPFARLIPRVPMNGRVVEVRTLEDALKLLKQQPVGAKLHVFSPEIDLVGEEGLYEGPSSPGSRYVGLRDVMITGNGTTKKGEAFAEVKVLYKKREFFVKVSATRVLASLNGDDSQLTEPTGLLVDFIVPRFAN
ncbi:unnamed protein product [Thlaspi arvense]|uniref:Uncharacterized protein n=1 Tax=Thlaspi arvense TaxID=13288 RepID=A0AAU9SJ97_THLAR|nr:unnamed protein product [Thlaspi arvense]